MSLLNAIDLNRLRNGEYVEMGDDTKKITDELAADVPEIVPAATEFNDAITAIKKVFVLDPASPLTHAIELADERRDAAITGLSFLAQGFSYSAAVVVKSAGEILSRAISVYGMGVANSIARQSYTAESASINGLLADFINKAELAAAIITLGLTSWITELKAANDDFIAKYQERTDAYGDASPDTARALRTTADTAFKKLRGKAESYYNIHDGAAPWSTLVNRLNAMVTQYKTLIASHPPGKPRGKKDGAGGEQG